MDPHTSNAGREACHSARDAYLACVDKHTPVVPLDATLETAEALRKAALAAPACAPQRAAYEATCLPSWRQYWDDRVMRGRPIIGRK